MMKVKSYLHTMVIAFSVVSEPINEETECHIIVLNKKKHGKVVLLVLELVLEHITA